MKVSYNIKDKVILTWWNETGGGAEDCIIDGEEDIKTIINVPDVDSPVELDYPITHYIFDDSGKLIVDDGRINEETPTFVETFHSAKPRAISLIDEAADKVRGSFITSTPSQMIVYLMKEEEARRFIAAGYPTETGDYIMLTKEAAERNISINDLADTIIQKINEWKVIAANIEGIRLKYKDLIMSLNAKTTEVDDVMVITEEAIRILKEI